MLGASGEQYRPSGGLLPMETLYAQPMLAFDVDAGFSFARPIGWGIPTEYVLTDRRDDTQVADILVASGRTYFVASVEPLRPPCVWCVAGRFRLAVLRERCRRWFLTVRRPLSCGRKENLREAVFQGQRVRDSP